MSRTFSRASGALGGFESAANFREICKTQRGIGLRFCICISEKAFYTCLSSFISMHRPFSLICHWQLPLDAVVYWRLPMLNWHPYSCCGTFVNSFGSNSGHADCFVASLCFGKRFNIHWKLWGVLKRLSPPSPYSPSSLGSCTLQSCAYGYVYVHKYFSLAVWRKYTLV